MPNCMVAPIVICQVTFAAIVDNHSTFPMILTTLIPFSAILTRAMYAVQNGINKTLRISSRRTLTFLAFSLSSLSFSWYVMHLDVQSKGRVEEKTLTIHFTSNPRHLPPSPPRQKNDSFRFPVSWASTFYGIALLAIKLTLYDAARW
jgi:hypothetical protein